MPTLFISGCFAVIAPDRTAPSAPLAVTATADTASARISWSRPRDDGGAVLTGYTASAVQDPLRGCEVSANDTSCVINGLSAGIAYTFVVQARNRKGVSPASDPSAPVIPIMGLPGTPTAISVRPGNSEIIVSWSPPDHAGGGTLTGYVAGVSGDTALSCTAGPSDTACVVTGLKNDSAYVMEVRARNPVGLGSAKVHATAAFPSFFTTWTRVNISVNFLNGITWTGNQFVVSGGGGALYTSPDGITWTNRSLGVGYSLWSVAAGNGILVVVGDGGLVRTSTDGVVWTSRVAPHTSGPSFRKVIWTGTKFVAVGFSYLNGGTVGTTLTSPDGVNWISGVAGEHPNALLSAAWMPLYSVTPGTGLIVGVGVSGLLRTSPDGSAWTTRASGTNRSLNGIAYGTPASIGATGQRVGVGDGGTVIRSLDGAVWTDQQVGTANILSVVWNGAHFVAIAADGTVHHSADGVAWRSTPTSHGFSNGSAWNGARLAVTIENGILLSPPIH